MIHKISTLVLLILCVYLKFSFSQTQGPNNPSNVENQPIANCGACAGSIWQNDQNVYAADNQFASVSLQNYLNCAASFCYWSRYLHVDKFNFNIPSNATIKGIQVIVLGYASAPSSVYDSTIVLSFANTPMGSNHADLNAWSTSNDGKLYGSPTDTWNYNWTPSQINNNNFGAFIKVYNSTLVPVSAFIDNVTILITYSLPTGAQYTVSSQPQKIYYSENQIIINTNYIDSYNISIFDISGKELHFETFVGSQKINATSFPKGIYFVRIEHFNDIQTRKIAVF